MAEVRVQALEAQLDIGGLMDPGSMAEAVSLELDGDETGTVPAWPHDSWVELNAEPTGFVTLVAAEDDEMALGSGDPGPAEFKPSQSSVEMFIISF